MDQLSSCYFCGDALDASLSEYPVVPKQLHPDPADQQTVVLCQACRQKLAPIVERVVESARDASDAADASSVDPPTGGADEAAPSRSNRAAGVEGETIDVGDGVRDAGGNRSAADGSSSADAEGWGTSGDGTGADAAGAAGDEPAERESATADDGGRAYTSSQAAGGRPVNGDGTVGDGSAARTASGGGAGDTGPSAGGSSGDSGGSDGGAAGAGGAGEGAANTGERAASDDAAENDGDEGDDAGPSMSALEYNKVIRLLQNRELPVDRAEFQTVALNAYDLEREEFEAILDAAVNRGLIAEENGKIVSAK